MLPRGPHLVYVVWMNQPADHVCRPMFTRSQTCVFPTHTIKVNRRAVGRQHRNNLGNEIHKLLEIRFRTLTLGYIDHRPHEFGESTRAV
jgi:hypothetical protein